MTDRYKILVIDGLADTGKVLKAVLEPRGMLVEQVRSGDLKNRESSRQTPHIIVFHTDDASTIESFHQWKNIPRIVIGPVAEEKSNKTPNNKTTDRHYYLQKPFEFHDLLCAIEERLHVVESLSAKAA